MIGAFYGNLQIVFFFFFAFPFFIRIIQLVNSVSVSVCIRVSMDGFFFSVPGLR